MSGQVILLLVAGLALLVVGAEILVRGAARLAAAAGISSLVIGLTVVAYGTSAPEMSVSLLATLGGQPDIAVGNVVGSNIFNVLFILGLSAIVAPLSVSRQLVRLDVPVMIGISLLAWLMASNGVIGRSEGLLLLAGSVGYTVMLLRVGRAEPVEQVEGAPAGARGTLISIAFVAIGLVLLVMGSRWLVSSATAIARGFGISELVIGLTIIAAGTSLPELATSVLATIRGQRDIAVGNVVGSNIFNILAILGVSAVVSGGIPISEGVQKFDLPVMTAVAVACLPIFFTGWTIARWEGAVFLMYYAAYTIYLALHASDHALLDEFGTAVLLFVLPITVLTLVLSLVGSRRGSRLNAPSTER